MTRFAVDADTALRIVRESTAIPAAHSLVAPSVIRSQVLSALYAAMRAGSVDEADARRELDRFAELKIRLLGDRVSRMTAWRIARQLDWADPIPAEYLAVASLQADVLVTGDPGLRAGAEKMVPPVTLVPFEALTLLARAT